MARHPRQLLGGMSATQQLETLHGGPRLIHLGGLEQMRRSSFGRRSQ